MSREPRSRPDLPAPRAAACFAHAARSFASRPALLLGFTLASGALYGLAFAAFASAGVPIVARLAFVACTFVPLQWGVSFLCLRVARGEPARPRDVLRAFDRYGEAMAAYFVLWIAIGLGLVCGIAPGIWLYCRTRFVPYLVIEEEVGAADAIAESLRLTRGYGATLAGISLGGIALCVGGVALAGLGLLPALLTWELALASLYHATVLPSRTWEPESRLARPALSF